MSLETHAREPLFTQNYIIICLINLVMVIATFPMVAVLPLFMSAQISSSPSVIGLAIGIFPFFALLSRPGVGWLLDNFRIKPLFCLGLLFYSLFFIAYPLMSHAWVLITWRAVHGLFFGLVMTSAAAAMIRVVPLARRGEGVGYFSISLSLGMALGPFIALSLIEIMSFRFFFHFLTLILVAGLFALFFCVKIPQNISQTRKPFVKADLFLKQGAGLAFQVFIINTVYAGLAAFVVVYAVDLGYATSVVSLFFALMALVMLVTRLFAGRIFDVYGPCFISSCGIVVLGAGCLLMAWPVNVAVFLLGGACVGLGVGILFPILQTMINNLVRPEKLGVANATYYIALDLGWVGGAFGLGFVVGLTSIKFTYILSAGLCVLSLIVFLALNLKHYYKHRVVD